MNDGRFVVRASRSEAGVAAACLGMFFLMRLFHGIEALQGRESWESWWAIAYLLEAVLSGFALFGALFYLVTRSMIVAVGPEGVVVPTHSRETIPWAAIKSGWVEGEAMLCLHLRDPARYPPDWWNRGRRKPNGADVAIRLTHAEDELGGLIDAVSRFSPRLLA